MVLNRLASIAVFLLLSVVIWTGYRFVRAQIEVQIYRDRLIEVDRQLRRLRDDYNAVVRKTAVTELVVRGGRVSVQIRTADGVVESIPTPYRTAQEIYVDYVVLDGRLWIRRVFDAQTRPLEGIVIDPRRADIDWDATGAAYGKAVYRHLDDGRWIITVSGDGSLGLTKLEADVPVDLGFSPQIHDDLPLQTLDDKDVRRISATEILRWLMGGKKGADRHAGIDGQG